jgi:hypothetical protein
MKLDGESFEKKTIAISCQFIGTAPLGIWLVDILE